MYSLWRAAAVASLTVSLLATHTTIAQTRGTERLEALSTATVTHEDGRAIVQGLPTFGFPQQMCTYIGSLEAALAVTEHPYDYAYLMGVSGMAFRLRAGRESWGPSGPVGEFPGERKAVSAATGWRFRRGDFPDMTEPHVERYTDDIVASIDAGLPLLAYDASWNVGVLIGYEDAGAATLMRVYDGGDDLQSTPTEDMLPYLVILDDHDDPPPPLEVLRRTLETAVSHWNDDGGTWGETDYQHGKAVYERWIAALGDVESIDPDGLPGYRQVSIWTYQTLCNAREAASKFLRSQAPILNGAARDALVLAATLYEEEHVLLLAGQEREHALMSHTSGSNASDWTREGVEPARETLRQAAELEEQAVVAIERTLAAMGR